MNTKPIEERLRFYKKVKQKMRSLRSTVGDEDIEAYNTAFDKVLEEGLLRMFGSADAKKLG